MNDVVIDAVSRTARVGAGVMWSEVIPKAAKAGLAPLSGSNPTVGVAGYTLGGGLSPTLGRSQGYAADHVWTLISESMLSGGKASKETAPTVWPRWRDH